MLEKGAGRDALSLYFEDKFLLVDTKLSSYHFAITYKIFSLFYTSHFSSVATALIWTMDQKLLNLLRYPLAEQWKSTDVEINCV